MVLKNSATSHHHVSPEIYSFHTKTDSLYNQLAGHSLSLANKLHKHGEVHCRAKCLIDKLADQKMVSFLLRGPQREQWPAFQDPFVFYQLVPYYVNDSPRTTIQPAITCFFSQALTV